VAHKRPKYNDSMLNVIVLAGGTSPEREISKRSGSGVMKALRANGHTAQLLDPAEGLHAFLPQLKQADVVFPALHGAGGEDGIVQNFLEDHQIVFVGSDGSASEICFDKARFASVLDDHKIRQPKTELVDVRSFKNSELRKRPFVLKPNRGGSSIDTFIVRDLAKVPEAAIHAVFDSYETLLLQQLVEGTEVTVGVLDGEALPVIEIIPPAHEEFDYKNKYNGATQELCPPKNVSDKLQKQAQRIATQVHELTGCRHLSRTDIIITPEGEMHVLEINTIPGLTDQSLLPKAAAHAGYDMPALIDRLVKTARQGA